MALGAIALGATLGNLAGDIYATQKNIQFQREENQKAREWQEKMSNTAYQRTVADLEKAGLNKMLAYGASPANMTASSTGAQASASRSADFNSITKGYEMDKKNEIANIKLQNEQLALNAKQARFNAKLANIDLNNGKKVLTYLRQADV